MRRFLPVATLAFAVCAGTAAPVRSQSDIFSSDFDCVIEPRLRMKIATPVAGVLSDVAVDRGSLVRQGEVIAKLESGVEQAAVAVAKTKASNDSGVVGRRARAEFLGRKRDRFQELRNKSATSENTFDEIDADYQTAKQDLREAEYNLELNRLDTVRAEEVLKQRSILSPLDGIVVERNLWRGEYAYEQAPIVTLAQVDPLNVEVYLPTKFYNAIVVGSDATVQPELQEGGRYRATIEIIDSVFDSRSSTFGVRLLLPNPGNKLPAGLHCKVRFLAK